MGTVLLEAGNWRAVIDPRLGGSLLELTHAGRQILRSATEESLRQWGVRAAACFPMIPYANRIDHGRLRVAGREYPLRSNFPASVHPLHGLAWQRPWRLETTDDGAVELALEHRPEIDGPQDWPFPFDARQRFELTSDGLTIGLSLCNSGDEAWPAGLGLHPNFSVWPGHALQFGAEGVWGNGPDHLPERVLSGPEWDFREPRALEPPLALDHDFFGWARRTRLTNGPAGAVLIEASEPFSVLRVYTPPEGGSVSVEPTSHIADAVNRPQAPGSGYHLLPPGDVLAGTVTLSLEDASAA